MSFNCNTTKSHEPFSNFSRPIFVWRFSRFPDGRESTVSVSDLAPLSDMSDNEPCDGPETTTENRTSDTETVQSETGQNGHAGHDATETNQTV